MSGKAVQAARAGRREYVASRAGELSMHARLVAYWAICSGRPTVLLAPTLGFRVATETGLSEQEAYAAIEELVRLGVAEMVPDHRGRDGFAWMNIKTGPH